jgi:DNA-binding MarR family transcriptional regulator
MSAMAGQAMKGRRLEGRRLEGDLSYWLHYVGYRLCHELCRKVGKFGVTGAESVVLRALEDNPCVQVHLARVLGVSEGYISRLAARLEAKQFIDRERSRTDRRSVILSLNMIGRALVYPLAALADEVEERNFSERFPVQCQAIESVMKRIVLRDQCRLVPATQCRMSREVFYRQMRDAVYEPLRRRLRL